MKISILTEKELRKKYPKEASLELLYKGELAGVETVPNVIEIEGLNKKELREMLNHLGCFTRNIYAHAYRSHVTAIRHMQQRVFNLVNKLLFKLPDSWENSVLGRANISFERIHIKGYFAKKDTWIITAHTEVNIITTFFKRLYHEHMFKGAGNYIEGTKIFYELTKEYKRERKLIPTARVEEIINKNIIN